MYKLSERIKTENNKVLEFSSHHSQFHYLASDCNLNIASIMILTKNYHLVNDYIEKSIFMYPENKKAIEIKNNFQSNTDLKIEYIKTDGINFEMIKSEKRLGELEKIIELETENKNTNKIKDYLLEMLKIIDSIHHNYHVLLAEKYFELAKLYIDESLIFEGKLFIEKALETDKKNPNNEKYIKLLSKL